MRKTLALFALLAVAATHPAPRKAPAKRAAPADWTKSVAPTPDGGYRMGNPNAAVKLVEYGSRTCPHCALFAKESVPQLQPAIASGKLSYEFREYPIHQALDLAPILIGRCVATSRFFPLLDAMMAQQETLLSSLQSMSSAEQERLSKMNANQFATYLGTKLGYVALAGKFGVPAAKAKACLANPKGIQWIAANAAQANKQYNVGSTPTFIINGQVTPGATYADLQPALAAAGL